MGRFAEIDGLEHEVNELRKYNNDLAAENVELQKEATDTRVKMAAYLMNIECLMGESKRIKEENADLKHDIELAAKLLAASTMEIMHLSHENYELSQKLGIERDDDEKERATI